MDIQTMRIFQTVAKKGSFSAAAHELNYAQSNISIKMQQLETDLQSSLFFRHNRGITLTSKGVLLLEYTEKILNLIDETSHAMLENGVARGPLSIGSTETVASIYLPKILGRYHKENPDVTLSLTTGTTTNLLELVLSHELDAAFVTGPINHPDLDAIIFKTEELVLVSSKTSSSNTSWKNITERTLLAFHSGCSYRKNLEQLFLQEGLTPEHIIEFNSLGSMIASVCAGLGMSLLPLNAVKPYINDGLISSFKLPNEHSSISTVLVFRKDHFKSTAFKSFLEYI